MHEDRLEEQSPKRQLGHLPLNLPSLNVWRTVAQRFHNMVHRSILHGAAISIGVRVAGLGLGYLANILLSRALGLEAYGQYVIGLSWALVLALPAKAGFDTSTLRYSTVYLEKTDFGRLRGFIRFAAAFIIAVWAAIAAVIMVAGRQLIPIDAGARTWAALLIAPLALLAFCSVLMRTARRIVAAQFYDQVLRPGLIIVGLGVAAFAGRHLESASAMALTTIAAWGALAALIIHLRRALRQTAAHAPRYDDWREWLAVSVPMLVLSVFQELMNQIDIILLGQLADEKQAALFAASWRLASLVPFGLVGLATMAGPLIAAAHDHGATDELHQVSSVVARTGFTLALVGAGMLYLLGDLLLGLFGPGFIQARTVLSVLLLGGIVNAFTGVVAYFATLTGRERHALLIFAGALALSIALNLLLIPRFGAVGAAVASSSATAAWNVAMLVYVRRTIGIDASALALTPKFTLIER
jgi:O-antigen/teichoic acid export membrane protein